MAGFRLVGTVNSVEVELPGSDPLEPEVPHVAGAVRLFRENYLGGRLGLLRIVEETEDYRCGVPTEDGKLDSSVGYCCTEG